MRWGPTPGIAARRIGVKFVLFSIGIYLIGMSIYPIYRSLDAAISHGIHRRGGTYTVDLRAMSDFELNQIDGKTQDIPKPFRDLDGKPVMLVGQMWSPNGAGGKVRNFDLVYSIGNCCFIGPPKVQHFVHASVPPGRNIELKPRPRSS